MSDRIEQLIAKHAGDTRAERVHAAMVALSSNSTYTQIVLCELSWEAWDRQYWTILRKPNGKRYRDGDEYMQAIWGPDYGSEALRYRRRLGGAIAEWPDGHREWLRQQLADLGLTRACLFNTPLRREKTPEKIAPFFDRAKVLTWDQCRDMLSEAFGTRRPWNVSTMKERCPSCNRVIRPPRLKRKVDPAASGVHELAAVAASR